MPELPEVETVARDLRRSVIGCRVTGMHIRERRLRRGVALDLPVRLLGRTITGAERRGKFLVLSLDGGGDLVVHLGMSGTLRVEPATALARVHDHVRLDLDDGRHLVLNDPRRFGLFELAEDGHALSGRLGVDPSGEEFTADRVRSLVRGRRRPIKSLLMEQSLVAGLGNIYVNEILFHAGVRPGRAARRLTRAECDALVQATRVVLREAIRRRGSSISDFHDAAGNPGGFQDRFFVYARDGAPCRRCATLIRRSVHAGRSSFYCARCQR